MYVTVNFIILSVVWEISKLDVLNNLCWSLFHAAINGSFQTFQQLSLILYDQSWVRVVVDLLIEVRELLAFDNRIIKTVWEVTLVDEKEVHWIRIFSQGLELFDFKLNLFLFLRPHNMIKLCTFWVEASTSLEVSRLDNWRLWLDIRFLKLFHCGRRSMFLGIVLANFFNIFLVFSWFLILSICLTVEFK